MILLLSIMGIQEGHAGQRFKIPALNDFISDTLYIDVPQDSTDNPENSSILVRDSRNLDGTIVGIRQTKKVRYIPVDQYLALDQPLANLFQTQFSHDSLELSGTLHLSKLILWNDNSGMMQKGLCLSAYTTFHDTLDQAVSDWICEMRIKPEKKEADTLFLGRVIQELVKEQSRVLDEREFNTEFYPYLFRRQLMTWSELIFFNDGYAINAHFTLDKVVKPSDGNIIEVDWRFNAVNGAPHYLMLTALDENLTRYGNSPISFIPNTYHPDGSTVAGGYGCFGSVAITVLEL